MIKVTRLNGKTYIVNAELIETMEETPDTVLTLTDGKRFIVKESVQELLDEVLEYKRDWFFMERFNRREEANE